MVEKVAKAIFSKSEHWLVLGGDVWETAPKIQKAAILRQAEAAIAEMRMPTDAMCEVGYSVESEDDGTEHVSIKAWKAMIDEALK